MESRKFTILADNKSKVNDHLNKLNRRATKLGLSELVYAFSKPYVFHNGQMVIDVDLTGLFDVSYQDWEFVATLQHLSTGENIIRAIIDSDIPEKYRNAGSNCEHCQVNRYRIDTYLVRHRMTGKYIQVGSSCMKDFLGGNIPDNLIKRATWSSDVNFYCSSINYRNSDPEGTSYFIDKFLEQTSACISVYGWLSKSKAYETGAKPTVSYIQDMLLNGDERVQVSEQDRNKAHHAIEWAENLTDHQVDSSDYLYNIRAIARSGVVVYRTMGFAASIIPTYEKEQLAKKAKVESNFVSTLKSREEFTLQLTNKFSFMTNYGVTHKYIFKDNLSNVITWNASKDQELLVGNKYIIKATVKAHTEYKGVKQTEVSRGEILCELEER